MSVEVDNTAESSSSSSSLGSDDQFEDAHDQLSPLPTSMAAVRHDNPLQVDVSVIQQPINALFLSPVRPSPSVKESSSATRRVRLNALRNRMLCEFGSSTVAPFSGGADDDGASASESASLASWGRNLLMENHLSTCVTPIYPSDSISTRAFPVGHFTSSAAASPAIRNDKGYDGQIHRLDFLSPSSRMPPPPLPITPYRHCVAGVKLPPPNSIPPPLPPRRPAAKLPNAIPAPTVEIAVDESSSSLEETEIYAADGISYNSTKLNDSSISGKRESVFTNSFARIRGHAKTNSLDRGLSLAKSMKTGPFPPPANKKSNSLKRDCSMDTRDGSSLLSFDDGEEDIRNNDAKGVISQITSSILNESLKEETSNESSVCVQSGARLSSVGEESIPNSTATALSNINEAMKCSEDSSIVNSDGFKIQIVLPNSGNDKKMDSDSSSRDVTFENEVAVTKNEEKVDGKKCALGNECTDPITRDVERRMSMKGHQQSLKGEDNSGFENSSPSTLGKAAGFVKGYGTYATELFRGAFLRAKGAVHSNASSKLPKEDESCHETDGETSVADGTPIVRPKSTKKGPFDFDGTRCFQELSNEHTGAVWCMKFSLCGRLLAIAGQDNIIRVWVLRNHLSYFNALRERYNMHSKKNSNVSLGEGIAQMQDIENELRSSSATLGDSGGSSSSRDDENGIENTALIAPKPLCTYRGHTADVLDLSWSRNYFILSSGMDRTVKLWHLSRPECLCCFQHMDFVTCVAFMPKDDRYFLSGSLDGKLRLWHIPEKKVTLWNEVEQVKFITAIAFVKNSKFAVVGTYDGRCFFYTTDHLKYHTVIDVRSNRSKNIRGPKVTGLAVHGDKLLVTSNDSRIRMYDLRDMALTCKFRGAQNERSQIRASFSPDGKHIVCGSEDRFIYIWTTSDLPSSLSVRKDRNDCWQRIRGHSACVTVAIFAPRPQLFLNLIDQKQRGVDEKRIESTRSQKNASDRQIHGDVIISADLSGSIRIFVNRTRIKAGASNFFATDMA